VPLISKVKISSLLLYFSLNYPLVKINEGFGLKGRRTDNINGRA